MKLRVKCPYCGAKRSTRSVKRVICFKCYKFFRVFYKARSKGFGRSTIVAIEEGSRDELYREFYKLKESTVKSESEIQ